MIISMHQPNFLPWYGFFDKLIQSSKFVFFDNAQLPRGKSYVSRTNILLNNEKHWLTIPVKGKSSLIKISEVEIDTTQNWKRKHLKTIELSYKKAPFFDEVYNSITKIYDFESNRIADFNINAIEKILEYLNVNILLYRASELVVFPIEDTGIYLKNVFQKLGCDTYLTGTGAGSKRYISELENEESLNVIWQEASDIIYTQCNSRKFISHLSVIDLLFNHGKSTVNILKEKSKAC
jgi:hypothetical protein